MSIKLGFSRLGAVFGCRKPICQRGDATKQFDKPPKGTKTVFLETSFALYNYLRLHKFIPYNATVRFQDCKFGIICENCGIQSPAFKNGKCLMEPMMKHDFIPPVDQNYGNLRKNPLIIEQDRRSKVWNCINLDALARMLDMEIFRLARRMPKNDSSGLTASKRNLFSCERLCKITQQIIGPAGVILEIHTIKRPR